VSSSLVMWPFDQESVVNRCHRITYAYSVLMLEIGCCRKIRLTEKHINADVPEIGTVAENSVHIN
jgi:hypothetical protein